MGAVSFKLPLTSSALYSVFTLPNCESIHGFAPPLISAEI